jgi:hypothetical protein
MSYSLPWRIFLRLAVLCLASITLWAAPQGEFMKDNQATEPSVSTPLESEETLEEKHQTPVSALPGPRIL